MERSEAEIFKSFSLFVWISQISVLKNSIGYTKIINTYSF